MMNATTRTEGQVVIKSLHHVATLTPSLHGEEWEVRIFSACGRCFEEKHFQWFEDAHKQATDDMVKYDRVVAYSREDAVKADSHAVIRWTHELTNYHMRDWSYVGSNGETFAPDVTECFYDMRLGVWYCYVTLPCWTQESALNLFDYQLEAMTLLDER